MLPDPTPDLIGYGAAALTTGMGLPLHSGTRFIHRDGSAHELVE
jgi:hypothetical protein